MDHGGKKPIVIDLDQVEYGEELYVNDETPHEPSPLKDAKASFPLKAQEPMTEVMAVIEPGKRRNSTQSKF